MSVAAPPERRLPAGDPAPQPLALVGDELAVSLNEARAALEQYVDGEAGNAPLERCAALLHTVRGVLQITETWGGSLLAEEMEQTCQELLKGRREAQPAEAIESLTRAIVQLPAYVERIRHGGRDVPLVLLPLLNDLRAARGRPLLSESTLLLLNLGPAAGGPAAPPARTPTGENVGTVAKSLRPRFQLALLGWIRGDDAGNSLGQLRAVAARLEAAAKLDVVHQLWWVVGGVLEALADGGLEATVSVKRLIGQSDRELKRLQSLGEKRFAEQPPVELTNNLLYYVARASGTGPRISAIRTAFNLSGLIPGDEQVERVRESLGAPSVRLMQTVAGAIREDLARVKDVLDIYVRTGMERVEELAPQVEMLKKIGDTLGVLGLGQLREAIEGQRVALEALTGEGEVRSETALVTMAAALLDVEDRLEPELLALIDAGDEQLPPAPTPADGSDAASLMPAVMRECLANLARVKEAISVVTERSGEPAALDGVPALLRGITAALLMLELERAARLAESIATVLRAAVEPRADAPGSGRLERLADAIVSLEYYMETLQAGRREPAYMLDNAERCVQALSSPPPEMPLVSSDAATEVSIPNTVTVAIDRTDPTRTRPAADRPVIRAGGQGIDPEILELFIDEAREAIDTILARFPAWELDEGDRDALLTIRRAYHTLKGSGRMVGAELIGEYAWAIEHLLNRVLDGTVARTPDLLTFLRRAGHGMAQLLEQLEVGQTPTADIPGLMASADGLARQQPEPALAPEDLAGETELLPDLGEWATEGPANAMGNAMADGSSDVAAAAAEPAGTLPELPVLTAVPPAATVLLPALDIPYDEPEPAGPAAPEPPPEPAGMDPVLLDILSREVSTHLGTLRAYLTRQPEPGPVPEAVFRAGHTLHGSLTMATVADGVAVAEPLNDLVAALHASHRGPGDDARDAMTVAAAVIDAVVAQLRDPARPVPDTAPVAARLAALTAALMVEAAADEAQADNGTLSVRIAALEEEPESEPAQQAADGEADESSVVLVAPRSDTGPVGSPAALPPVTAPALDATPPPDADVPPPGAMTMAVAFDAEIAGFFAEEAAELLEASDPAVAQLISGEQLPQALDELKRNLHTLKGGARMARLFAMGDLSHELETLIIRMDEGQLPRRASTLALIRTAFDELHRLRDGIADGALGVVPPGLLEALVAAGHDEPAAAPPPADAAPEPVLPDLPAALAADAADADDAASQARALDQDADGASDDALAATDADAPAVPELTAAALLPADDEGLELTARLAGSVRLPLVGPELPVVPEMPAEAGSPAVEAFAAPDPRNDDPEYVATGVFGPDFIAAGDEPAPALADEAIDIGDGSVVLEAPLDPGDGTVLADALEVGAPAPGPDALDPGDGTVLAEAIDLGDPAPTPDLADVGEPPARPEPAEAGAADGTAPYPVLEPGSPTLEKLGELARDLAAPPIPASGPASGPTPAPVFTPAEPLAARAADARLAEARARDAREVARVDAQLLETLLNGAGEISIANSRLNQQLGLITFHLDELGQTVLRLRDQLRKLEMETEAQILHRHQAEGGDRADFDPLELDRYSTMQQLARSLAESASDVSSLKDLLQSLAGDTEALLVQQARTTTELQDGLMRTRMVPFQQHGARLTRLVRQTARETGKLADLVIEGGGELDRQVLEKMLPPFEHMLRNAVVHGIESAAERQAAAKPATGTIRIAVRREGAEVVIDVADDGRGLDVAAIRRKAQELNFLLPGQLISDEQAMQFILRTGFSTADRLTQQAGRGIGMDVVANQVSRLGGTLGIASRPGQGTTFTLRLPFTLAVTQALIVRVGAEVYALPLPTVEGIIRLPRAEFESRMRAAEPTIDYGGRHYPFRHLGQFVGLPGSRVPDDADRVAVILVRGGDQSAALVTDEMQDSREIVVKPVGPQLATIRGISGATILGDGRIVMILDVAALVRAGRAQAAIAPPPAAVPAGPVALVVDDSITMRRVTQRLLERNGYRVVTAKDGLDAISALADHRPDVILLDVEMPRMDGYEFARHVRNQPELKAVPIVMVTSRVSDKHRARAIEIGVNDYLGKPYQERELLQAVNALLGR